jgi:hypothetical protein
MEGDSVYVTGDKNQLGNWKEDKAVKLTTTAQEFPIWTSEEVSFEIDPKEFFSSLNKDDKSKELLFEYKYFIKSKNGNQSQWEKFVGNRQFTRDLILENLEDMPNDIEFFDWSRNFIINGEIFNDNILRPHINFQKPVDRFSEEKFFKEGVVMQNRNNISNDNPDKSDDSGSFEKFEGQELENNRPPEIQPEVFTNNSETLSKDGSSEKSHLTLDDYLNELSKAIDEIKSNKFNLHDKISGLLEGLKDTKKIDKELLVIIMLHFYKSGQLKFPEDFSSLEHKHHHDSALARSIYTYLLQKITSDNSLLIKSILSCLPTCLDYRVMEQGQKNYN